jgi:hypothetical protein
VIVIIIAVVVVILIVVIVVVAHVRWDPCPHSMARPRVADGGTASRYGG